MMRRFSQIVLILLGSLLISIQAFALVSSNKSGGGDWSAPASWDIGVPICGDSIHIVSGDVVTIAVQQDYSACGTPMVLIIDGTIVFPGNGPKLKLPAGSTVIVNPGGLITAPGGGNGNKIFIGVDWVWEKLDGDVLGYTCFGACGPLPIQLLSFDVVADENSISINWQTLTESNNEYFTVERSEDGIHYTKIVEVAGAGNSNNLISYKTWDYNPIQGVAYYRLKQTDFDGQYSYSEITAIQLEFSSSTTEPSFPNPISVSDDLVISFANLAMNDEVFIELRSMRGELKRAVHHVPLQDGQHSISVGTAGLIKPGIYLVSFMIHGEMRAKRLLIL